MKKYWLVYKHTLIADCPHKGWSYIGITSQSTSKRWQNGSGYFTCTVFRKAIDKYGWDNFTHEILAKDLTLADANKQEQYWISYYHTWVDDPDCHGYNLTKGGDGTFGHKCTTETKQKISLANKGRKMSNEFKEKIRKLNSGTGNPFYGKHHSDETKHKISLANKGKHNWSIAERQKISERNKGISRSKEERELLSKKLTGIKRSDETRKKMSEAKLKLNSEMSADRRAELNAKLSAASTNKCKVRCVETGEVFESVASATKFYNLYRGAISAYFRGNIKSTNGLHWEKVEE